MRERKLSVSENKVMMKRLRIQNNSTTLADQLLSFFKEKNLRKGDAVPNEMERTASLGVPWGVVREASSRLKLMGIVEIRTRRGMILSEPSLLGGMRSFFDFIRFGKAFDLIPTLVGRENDYQGNILLMQVAPGTIARTPEAALKRKSKGGMFQQRKRVEYDPVINFDC